MENYTSFDLKENEDKIFSQNKTNSFSKAFKEDPITEEEETPSGWPEENADEYDDRWDHLYDDNEWENKKTKMRRSERKENKQNKDW